MKLPISGLKHRVPLWAGDKNYDDYWPIWSYVPHFVHTPFYVTPMRLAIARQFMAATSSLPTG